jgi:hypothetical protein
MPVPVHAWQPTLVVLTHRLFADALALPVSNLALSLPAIEAALPSSALGRELESWLISMS